MEKFEKITLTICGYFLFLTLYFMIGLGLFTVLYALYQVILHFSK